MNKLKSLTLSQALLLNKSLIDFHAENGYNEEYDERAQSDVENLLDQLNDIIVYLEGKN